MIRVYSAMSLDGFLAGEGDDLSWLPQPVEGEPEPARDPGVVGFDDFLAEVGCMLMGRRTFDVVQGFGAWPYGDTPVQVVTHRALPEVPPTVCAVAGEMPALVADARRQAGGKDVYIDGGSLIRQALEANLVDELILTVVPTLLGRGIPVYGGSSHRAFRVHHHGRYGAMVQLCLRRED